MKITQIQPTAQIKQPIIKRIKKALIKPFANLKELVNDVFEYQKPKYVIVDGKKVKTNCSWLSPRELPNSVSDQSDLVGVTWSQAVFAPEDMTKMKNMTAREAINYKKMLIEQKRYTITEPVEILDLSDIPIPEYLKINNKL